MPCWVIRILFPERLFVASNWASALVFQRQISNRKTEINLFPPEEYMPATWKGRGKYTKAWQNIGNRPTVNGSSLTIEANIFDFDDDIYNETINIHLIARIRDEKKFDNLDLLKKQLSEDREMIGKMLI